MSTKIETTSPLYLHPSDGNNFLPIEKLQGTTNYRSWRRSMEISLASKRKLGFVTGAVKKETTDAVKSEAWDTCNNMIISWILSSVSDSIKRSVMFVESARAIWIQLEKRFSLTNGSRKYKLNKEVYETKQQNKLISEYYTLMKSFWEELESLNTLPAITTVTTEITTFIEALTEQKEELKLFQFLNGLDEEYGPQRSHILMMTPLPSVETACAYMEQEEAQRDLLVSVKEEKETLAMFSKGTGGVCSACNKVGHTREKCWTIVGYPVGHPRHHKGQQAKPKWKSGTRNNQRWSKHKQEGTSRVAANVHSGSQSDMSIDYTPPITTQQLEQLLKLLPTPSKAGPTDTDDEIDTSYSSMVFCYLAESVHSEWIVDSGASDHMCGDYNMLIDPVATKHEPKINLPTGETSVISHTGKVRLRNGLTLNNVLYIPSFKHNLISANKLCIDANCKVVFQSEFCIIQNGNTSTVVGVEKCTNGLYYLLNEPVQKTLADLNHLIKSPYTRTITKTTNKNALNSSSYHNLPSTLTHVPTLSKTTLWHYRLGHAPMSRIGKIKELDIKENNESEICITCPLAKFTKLPYPTSEARAKQVFDLVHIDTWGRYKVPTRAGYKYFLTVVDDYSRVTWVHLLKCKSDAFEAIETFVNMARTQFEKRVKVLRSDNALEFDDKKCRPFFTKLGIVHQTSYVDRPQQNGRAERKHRNILEMARSLRFQAGLPLQFWGDCVHTAVHITNRLPSCVLKDITPFEALYNEKPKYKHLRAFGCLAMASNLQL